MCRPSFLTMSIQTMEEVTEKKKRPLVRASSEESSSDPSFAPSPGDTLPWNLPKHHRIKRSKSASGDVLEPAERAVIRIAGIVTTAFDPWTWPWMLIRCCLKCAPQANVFSW